MMENEVVRVMKKPIDKRASSFFILLLYYKYFCVNKKFHKFEDKALKPIPRSLATE